MSYTVVDFISLLGSVCLFLYGMKVMSEGLQKVAVTSQHSRRDDAQPHHRSVDGYHHYCTAYPEFKRIHGDGCELCECRSDEP